MYVNCVFELNAYSYLLIGFRRVEGQLCKALGILLYSTIGLRLLCAVSLSS